MSPFILSDLYYLSPAVVLLIGALSVLICDLYLSNEQKRLLPFLSASVVVVEYGQVLAVEYDLDVVCYKSAFRRAVYR